MRTPIALLTALLASSAAFAQDAESRDLDATYSDLTREQNPVNFVLRGGGTFNMAADLDNGDVAVQRGLTALDLVFNLNDTARLILTGNYEYSWYDFDNATGLVPGTDDPLDEAVSYGFGARLIMPIEQGWSILAGAQLQWSYEDGAGDNDALTGGGHFGASYQFSDTLTLGLVVSASSRLEDEARVLPLPVIHWKFAEQWSLETRGPELRVSYEHSEELTAFIAGNWRVREYRLRDDGPLPSGVMQDSQAVVEAGVVWDPHPMISITGAAGAVVFNEYEFTNAAGSKISDEDTDTHLQLRFALALRF